MLKRYLWQNIFRGIDTLPGQVLIKTNTKMVLIGFKDSDRFYNRQFITRKTVSNDLLFAMENLLTEYFKGETVSQMGLPTVQYLADKLNVSSNYLSDMLRKLTGQNTQQHIHNKLIEKAKEKLSGTDLSVSEIAYELGFEHPQSFTKLFKSKTNMTPIKFKQSFN